MKFFVFIALRRYPVVSKWFSNAHFSNPRTLSYMIGILQRLPVYNKVTLLTYSLSHSQKTMLDPSKCRKSACPVSSNVWTALRP
jgi:hypothetical protein